MAPDVGHGQCNELGKPARPVHSNALRLCAQMPSPGQAVTATPAHHVAFTADDVAGIEVVDVGANADYLADKLMSNHHRHRNRLLGPVVPLEDMHVGAADAGIANAHQNVIDAHGRLCTVLQPQPAFGAALDQCLHALSSSLATFYRNQRGAASTSVSSAILPFPVFLKDLLRRRL